MKAYKMKIHGIVQGVGFRYYVYRLAKRYGIRGYVMNLPDGSVEVFAESEDENKLLEFLKEAARGPSTAVVTSVEKEVAEPANHRDFQIKYYTHL